MSIDDWQKLQEEQQARKWQMDTTTARIAAKVIQLIRDQYDFQKIEDMINLTAAQLQALWESTRKIDSTTQKIDERQEQLNEARVRALKAKLSTYVAHSKQHGE